ncbi:sodium/potassium/calcium exchanger 5-like, partial [Anneissia japonica]|uniref:sodium/potassium/calcium exchanger 5-like n=1 Tax=Anneissia japonica TaxID=1529436 RepID=UPI00142594F5
FHTMLSFIVDNESIFSAPENPAKYVSWIFGLPAIIMFFLTIPDCRRKGCGRNTYAATFCLATIWLAGLSYILVWMITIIGYTIHLSDNVMGFTFLAFGTSLPDLFGSIYVARDGYGDMAVANIIGSNIFEVLVCLGFLWFVRIATNSNWEPIEISSNSLILMSAGLFTTVIVIVVALWLKDWVLDRKLGLWSLATYVIFMTIVILYEQGLLGSIAEYPLPTCQVV